MVELGLITLDRQTPLHRYGLFLFLVSLLRREQLMWRVDETEP